MDGNVLDALDWDPVLECQLGPAGRGHDEVATVSFTFRCITADCAKHPKGPVRQGFVMCDDCLSRAEEHGIDCMRCRTEYQSNGWEWKKAVTVKRLGPIPEPRDGA